MFNLIFDFPDNLQEPNKKINEMHSSDKHTNGFCGKLAKTLKPRYFPRNPTLEGRVCLVGVFVVGAFFTKFLHSSFWSFLLQECIRLDRSPNVSFPGLHGSFKNWHPMWSPETDIRYFSGCRPPIHLCNVVPLVAASCGSQVCKTTLAVSNINFQGKHLYSAGEMEYMHPFWPHDYSRGVSSRVGRQLRSPALVAELWYTICCSTVSTWKALFAIAIQVAQLFMCSGREGSLGEASIKEPCQSQRPYRCSWVTWDLVSWPNHNATLALF